MSSPRNLPGNEIRQSFLDFFAGHGHQVVRSSPVVLAKDPTLLFANAGMNQFKDAFLGLETRDQPRATTAQKAIRAGGKHNDIDEVGRTPRHHTFFEMLGNFSFGDYFKQGAIEFSLELLLDVWGIPLEQLWFTVHHTDDDAEELWKAAGAPADRVLRFGDKDNFWEMGPTGPCGPCSEIHVYIGDDPAKNTAELVNADHPDNLEIWNLVFMQFDRSEDGTLTPLPNGSIDTGMGLERVASYLQGKRSNYDTDLLRPYIDFTANASGRPYVEDGDDGMSMRVIADHARCSAVMIADGVFPGNEGRSYVLRKIMRRALWHARRLELPTTWFADASDLAVELLSGQYPELGDAREAVRASVAGEARLFESTLDSGIKRLDEAIERSTGGVLAGEDVFQLYDTYGLRTDLIGYIAENRGVEPDWAGFEAQLEQQRERARRSWHADGAAADELDAALGDDLETRFLAYEATELENATVLAVVEGGQRSESLEAGESGVVVLDATPFYAQAGGQVGDVGVLENDSVRAAVTDTTRTRGGVLVHHVTVETGTLETGDTVRARADGERRRAIRANHTATHLVHAALREVLGPHVRQAGSLVAPDRLRFDFTHFAPVTEAEQEQIERLVNREIVQDIPVASDVVPLEQALETGAMALFGEKYPDPVRIVSIDGFSRELCGGTHVADTGEIGSLKITSSESVAAGVRRLEAVTGLASFERFQRVEHLVDESARKLGVEPDAMPDRIAALQQSLRDAERETAQLRLQLLSGPSDGGAEVTSVAEGVQVTARRISDLKSGERRDLAENLLTKADGVVVLAWSDDAKAGVLVRVADHLTERLDAREVANDLAAIIGGRGGGQPRLAEAGGREPARVDELLSQAPGAVEKRLG